jgi:exosortase/archaeosortase family protein
MRLELKAALIAFASAFAVVSGMPNVELWLFARATAAVAGLLSGAPSMYSSDGWLLPFQHQTLLVSEACSGASFFIMLASLLTWHLCQRWSRAVPAVLIGLPLALALSLLINALRVLCLSQAHRWLIPLLPENYAHITHLMIGVAVFLPALIALNTAFELYGHFDRNHS